MGHQDGREPVVQCCKGEADCPRGGSREMTAHWVILTINILDLTSLYTSNLTAAQVILMP